MKRVRRKAPLESLEKPLPATEDIPPSTLQKSETPQQAAKRSRASGTPVAPKRAVIPTRENRSSTRLVPGTVKETDPHNPRKGPLNTLTCSKQQVVNARRSIKDFENELDNLRKEMSRKDEEASKILKEKERIIALLVRDVKDACSNTANEKSEQVKLLDEMRKKNDDLENKLTFKDKQVENLENEIKMTMAKLLLSEASNSKANSELSATKDQLRSQIKARSEISQELTESQIEVENLELSYSKVKEELEAAKQNFETDLKEKESNLRKQIAELENKIAEHEEDAKKNFDECQLLRNRLEKWESELPSFKPQLKQSEGSTTEFQEIKGAFSKKGLGQASEDSKSSLKEKIKSLEATISSLNEKISSLEDWNNFFLESGELCECKSFENENRSLKSKIKVLSSEKGLLEKEVIILERRNRDLTDLIDIDKCQERVTEISQILNRLSQNVFSKTELDILRKRHSYILQEYKRWREVFTRKSSYLKTLADYIARTKAQLPNIKKTFEETLPIQKLLSSPSDDPCESLGLGPQATATDVFEEAQPLSLKRPRFMTMPLVRRFESRPRNEKEIVCDSCKQVDPPLSIEQLPLDEDVDWVGCECERWFHKRCLCLTEEEFQTFSCDKVKKYCLDGFITVD